MTVRMGFVGRIFIFVIMIGCVHAEGFLESLSNRFVTGNLQPWDVILCSAVLFSAFELLSFISRSSGEWFNAKTIPVRGKHLDEFTTKDLIFITISKAATAPFVYFYLRFCLSTNKVVWNPSEVSVWNTLLPLLPLFVVYDFFYTILHWALHIQSVYAYIHKHHHVQKAPSRANVDAINVHPLEFFLGEYNHLLALYLCTRFLLTEVHVLGAFLFLAVGGWLAGLNHTRYEFCWKIGSVRVFDSKAHDVHHRIPQSNYGQYTMLWDYIFGTYRPYNPNDRVNAEAQLDPKTGRSILFGKEKAR